MSRSRARQPEVHIPRIVVTYVGRIGWTCAAISGLLVWRIVELTASSETAADAAVIGLAVAFVGLTGTSLATLGAILASTRGGSNEPTPVTVENKPADPVPVEVPA